MLNHYIYIYIFIYLFIYNINTLKLLKNTEKNKFNFFKK